MKYTLNRASAVALLAVAGLIAGCGDDSSKKASEDPVGKALASTPEEAWASKVCTAIAAQAQTIQPPAVDPKDPAGAQKGLVTFFSSVGDQLDNQITAIEKVGPPPGEEAAADFDKALVRMKATEAQLTKIRKSLRSEDPKSSSDVNAIVADLGKEFQKLSKYQGPVADLSKSDTLATALAAEPACATVSG